MPQSTMFIPMVSAVRMKTNEHVDFAAAKNIQTQTNEEEKRKQRKYYVIDNRKLYANV